MLEQIRASVEELKSRPSYTEMGILKPIYDNRELSELLRVNPKYLKTLRDNGHIGYSHFNDKYWYSAQDVCDFMSRYHYPAFATGNNLPFQKGGYHD